MSINTIINNTKSYIPNRFKSLIPSLVANAYTSDVDFLLSAAVIKGSKFITPACPNLRKNFCKGNCTSLHAEANAIMTHYGKNLFFSEKLGWCYQCSKGKRCKIKKP
jgi:hypothetical protein